MQPDQVYEIIGYAASLLVALSLMMRSILRLRVINLIGAVFFTIYGLLIRAYPVAAVNFFIVLIDLYYLRQMLSTHEFFRLLEVHSGSGFLKDFLKFYENDIQRFWPGFVLEPGTSRLVFFILRNMVPAGLMIGTVQGDCLCMQLDYAIPGYRDLKIGRFLYQQHAQDFRTRGIYKISTEPGTPEQARYLRKMGFLPETGSASRLSLSLG